MNHNEQSAAALQTTALLNGGGEIGAYMRSLDWANTPFGHPETWPQSLRSAASICLNSRFPIAIYWGPQLALLYNDAWSPIPGEKHPWALGRPGREVWPEIWAEIGPLFEMVQQTGEGVWQQDQLLPMHRYGYTEECYFNFTFSPIRGEDGGVVGIFNAVVETTFRVIEERRAQILRDLSEQIANAKTPTEACILAASVLDRGVADLPFCLLYVRDANTTLFRLAAAAGVKLPDWLCPPVLDPADPASPWHTTTGLQSTANITLERLSERFGVALASDVWPETIEQAVILPLIGVQTAEAVGLLIAGVSPRRALDEIYRTFVERVASQTASAIGNALMLEAERQRAEALAEIDRAKTAFFSNVSHEFRTPLTLMLGPLEDLLQAEGSLAVAEREQIKVAYRNAMRLLKLVNTLLDFSRIEAGRIEASFEPTDLAAFTVDLVSVFRSAIDRARLQLVVVCPPLAEPVYIDRESWEKIVFNLLSNALKFTFAGTIEVTLQLVGAQAELAVRDTGIGIPADQLPHLFERFHRVKDADGRTFEGTGIGLALVQELAKMHGGSVRVESELGRGSRFVVAIPFGSAHLPAEHIGSMRSLVSTSMRGEAYIEEALNWLPSEDSKPLIPPPASEAKAAMIKQTPRPNAQPTARILLADDNADMREYIGRLLRGQYDVVAVADGVAALNVARTQPIDLVLSDVMMPRLDGFGLLAALRADERTKTLPVIFLSARAGEEARVEGLNAGADDYLVKPFSARELLARIGVRLEIARIRSQADAKVRASEERLQLAISANRMVVWEWLPNDDVISTSASFAEVYGLPVLAGAAQGFALVWPEDAAAHQTKVQQIAATGGEYVSNFRITRPDNGQTVWLEERAKAFVDDTGQVVRIMGVVVDMTQHKLAERRLQHLQAVTIRFAETQTLDDVRKVILGDVLAALGIQAGALRRVTPEGLILDRADLGAMIDPETARRFSFVPLIANHPAAEAARSSTAVFLDSAEAITAHYPELADSVIQNRIGSSAHLPLVSGENVFGVLSLNAPEPRVWDDGEQAFALALADRAAIAYERALLFEAERAAMEREQALRVQAEEANRLKDEFLASVSHELRTPLTSILGYAQLLQMRPRDEAYIARGLTKMVQSARIQAQLIEDLLDVSRIVTGKIRLDMQPIDLVAVVQSALDTVRPTIEAKGLHTTIDLDPQATTIRGDANRLQQVVWNLLTNAAKFTPSGGTIRIRLQREEHEAQLTVSDTGQGISATFLPFVFDRFRQANNTSTRSYNGLGLGLAIVRYLVELHGGTVFAASAGENQGATFTVQLPLALPADAAKQSNNSSTAAGKTTLAGLPELRGLRMLIVDDQPEIRELLYDILEPHGALLRLYPNAEEALQTLQEWRPDVLISDIAMPKYDGYWLIQAIRALPPEDGGLTPAIALTAYVRTEERMRVLAAGFQQYVPKPIDPDELCAVVAGLMRDVRSDLEPA